MAIEIVDLPIDSMVDLSIVMLVYQRVNVKKTLKKKVDHLASNGFWKISSLGGSKMGHLLDPT